LSTEPDRIIDDFDFGGAIALSPVERMRTSVAQVEQHLADRGWLDLFGLPPVPARGASEGELDQLRRRIGAPLPEEYEEFLRHWRYLILDDSYQVWGLDHDGVSIGSLWVSDRHRIGHRFLVFGHYWRYADGDQLLFDLEDSTMPVVVYLHEYPRLEPYAASFSLALWRMVHEWLSDAAEG
jgi:hypothetical protein